MGFRYLASMTYLSGSHFQKFEELNASAERLSALYDWTTSAGRRTVRLLHPQRLFASVLRAFCRRAAANQSHLRAATSGELQQLSNAQARDLMRADASS
jgi:hypothetical protein